MNREDIELLLWEYINETCSASDRERISQLVANNPGWHAMYQELTALHASIAGNIESEQPSMRFTKNVMDTIAQTHVAPAARNYINTKLIKGIAGVFICSIVSMIVYTVAQSPEQTGNGAAFGGFKFNTGNQFNSTIFNVSIMVNIIIALLFLDSVLRRQRISG